MISSAGQRWSVCGRWRLRKRPRYAGSSSRLKRMLAGSELEALLDCSAEAVYVVDTDWSLVYANARALAYWGRDRTAVLGRNIWESFPQAVGSESHEAHIRAARERRPVTLAADSAVLAKPLTINILPVREGMAVIFRERTEDIVGDLNHRLKNMITTFRGLVSMSLGDDGSLREGKQNLLARIDAIGCASDVVFNRKAGDLAQLAQRCLEPFIPDASRLRLEGPAVQVSARLATTLAMVLHELATNALKHGALALPQGQIDCRWSFEDNKLTISWQERGGSAAAEPQRRGFGLRFLESAFGGHARMSFGEAGFAFTGALTAAPGELKVLDGPASGHY